jgi:hypothetical protein
LDADAESVAICLRGEGAHIGLAVRRHDSSLRGIEEYLRVEPARKGRYSQGGVEKVRVVSAPRGRGDAPVVRFTRYQVAVVAILAFLQFTVVLDFMILSPLGAILMRDLGVSPARFGLVVSAYAFSAGISGLLAAGFADEFDRKRLLLFFYGGFVLGTTLCGLAPSYHLLLGARAITGMFGGVIGSISLAIVADLFPLEARGRVMGFVMTAFAASQVLGIPLGLYLSNAWGWHAPFLMIASVSAVVGVLIFATLRPIDGHLQQARDRKPAAPPRRHRPQAAPSVGLRSDDAPGPRRLHAHAVRQRLQREQHGGPAR